MSGPVVMFVGTETDFSKVTLPDDSILVGWEGKPMERPPEFFLGPFNDTVHFVLEPGRMEGYKCGVCESKMPQLGYIFVIDDSPYTGIWQCSNCGHFTYSEKGPDYRREVKERW